MNAGGPRDLVAALERCDDLEMNKPVAGWFFVCAAAVALFAFGASREAYDLTTPAAPVWHVLVRKAYSIGAFALLAFLMNLNLPPRWSRRAPVASIAGLSIYSALLEVVQRLGGATEGLRWNAVDVGCGAIGGALGYLAFRRYRLLSAGRESVP